MDALSDFINNFSLEKVVELLISAVCVMICMTIHELSHAFTAYKLGDPTAKEMGRLTLNPFKHMDLVGSLMLLFVGVGWAKPVQVDARYFKNAKRGMALTALAGPVSNLLLAFLLLCIYRLMILWVTFFGISSQGAYEAFYYTADFLTRLAVMSLGLGVFNLLPVPPLDGSKVLFSVLPDRAYGFILRYERFVMIPLVALLYFGIFDGVISSALDFILGFMLRILGL